tara:strand:+ start:233 stop:493 length:261 start_codon:yes stop_codon:yes gene_type:complete
MKEILKYLILFILLVNVSCEELDDVPGGEYNEFDCNKSSYLSMPDHDSKDGNYRFYTYGWQDDPQICINTYEGVSQESKTLITEVV